MNLPEHSMEEKGIELARRLNCKAAAKFEEKGLSPDQIALASILSAFDIAKVAHGHNGVAAIEWMRTNLDKIEAHEMER